MNRSFTIPVLTLALLASGLALRHVLTPGIPEQMSGMPDKPPARIVSMAPSITESLFAMGLGERVSGVTRYCRYPAAAEAKPKVGGLLDPDYESLVTLQTDLVLLLPYHAEMQARLISLKIRTLTVDHETVPAILESFVTLGEACGAGSAGDALRARVASELDAVRRSVDGLPRPTVLLCVGRSMESGRLDQLYISGPNGWHGQLVDIAGGQNVLDESRLAYPAISAEAVIRLNPDVIIEIANPEDDDAELPARLRAAWNQLDLVKAVKDNRVYIVHENYAGVPGPRISLLAEDFARLLHPEAGS